MRQIFTDFAFGKTSLKNRQKIFEKIREYLCKVNHYVKLHEFDFFNFHIISHFQLLLYIITLHNDLYSNFPKNYDDFEQIKRQSVGLHLSVERIIAYMAQQSVGLHLSFELN